MVVAKQCTAEFAAIADVKTLNLNVHFWAGFGHFLPFTWLSTTSAFSLSHEYASGVTIGHLSEKYLDQSDN